MSIPGAVARRIELIVFDADGVLTDGGVWVTDAAEPSAIQRFDIRDGVGIALLVRAGLDLAVVSSRESAAVTKRATELGIERVHQVSPYGKVSTVEEMLRRDGRSWSQVAFLADDLPDAALLERVGLPAAVGDAVPEIRQRAVWCATAAGGRGAVREFVEALLRARGQWTRIVEEYVEESRAGE